MQLRPFRRFPRHRPLRLLAIFLIFASPGFAAGAEQAADKDDNGLSLEAAREITFETSSVTWLSIDVSPDGSTFVMEVLGDLYLLPVAGGEASPLTTGMAFDSQPRFAPDGERVVFVSDRDGSENSDDRNDDHQFYQCESLFSVAHSSPVPAASLKDALPDAELRARRIGQSLGYLAP